MTPPFVAHKILIIRIYRVAYHILRVGSRESRGLCYERRSTNPKSHSNYVWIIDTSPFSFITMRPARAARETSFLFERLIEATFEREAASAESPQRTVIFCNIRESKSFRRPFPPLPANATPPPLFSGFDPVRKTPFNSFRAPFVRFSQRRGSRRDFALGHRVLLCVPLTIASCWPARNVYWFPFSKSKSAVRATLAQRSVQPVVFPDFAFERRAGIGISAIPSHTAVVADGLLKKCLCVYTRVTSTR